MSADCQVREPLDLWDRRIEAQFRHHIPRLKTCDVACKREDLEGVQSGRADLPIPIRDRKRDGEEGAYLYEGPGGQVSAHPVPPEVIGICRYSRSSANEGIEQTQVGAVANLVAPYFFPEVLSGT